MPKTKYESATTIARKFEDPSTRVDRPTGKFRYHDPQQMRLEEEKKSKSKQEKVSVIQKKLFDNPQPIDRPIK